MSIGRLADETEPELTPYKVLGMEKGWERFGNRVKKEK